MPCPCGRSVKSDVKPLIVCYSLTGKTKQLCAAMKRSLDADIVFVDEAKSRTLAGAYVFGSLAARTRKAAQIKPLKADISEYEEIIVAAPVWAGFPAPAINDFIRQYEIGGKRLYGFLTYAGNCGEAAKALEEDIAAANAECVNVLCLRTGKENVHAIRGGRLKFTFDTDGKLSLETGSVS